jgi:hypothetical protein
MTMIWSFKKVFRLRLHSCDRWACNGLFSSRDVRTDRVIDDRACIFECSSWGGL